MKTGANGVHQLEFNTESVSLTVLHIAIVVHMGVAGDVASSMCHVGGVDGQGLGDSVTGETEWVWSTAVVCNSR